MRRVVDGPDQLFADDRSSAHIESFRAIDAPGHLGHVLRDAAHHLSVEFLDDLRTALLPPHLGAGHLPAVLQRQDFRQVGIRVGERLVVVGVIGRAFISARAGTELLIPSCAIISWWSAAVAAALGLGGGPAGGCARPAAVLRLAAALRLAAGRSLVEPLAARPSAAPTHPCRGPSTAPLFPPRSTRSGTSPLRPCPQSFQLLLVRARAPCCSWE